MEIRGPFRPYAVPPLCSKRSSSPACHAWPKMHSMVLLNAFDLQAIRAFAQHRARIGNPLRRLVLSDSGPLVEDGLAALGEVQPLEVAVHSQVLNETLALTRSPFFWWDVDADKPAFVPWKGSFPFDDQFDRPPGKRFQCSRLTRLSFLHSSYEVAHHQRHASACIFVA